jgi:adenine-specific DNA-methyltransferase
LAFFGASLAIFRETLVNLAPEKSWSGAEARLIGITPIMDFVKQHYQKEYAPNTRETFRRQTMHQFVDAGIARYNPDDPYRPVNSPKAVYQISDEALEVIRSFGEEAWEANLFQFLSSKQALVKRYAKEREQNKLPVLTDKGEFQISPGEHSELIKAIIEDFAPRFTPQAKLIYAGDTGEKWGYFDEEALEALGVSIDKHGKMPDVVLYWAEKNWLILVESVTSHGPVNPKRHHELASLFQHATAGLVFVTAFPNRSTMGRYLGEIAWETEVWVADAPSHMIHFNGERFLGPY